MKKAYFLFLLLSMITAVLHAQNQISEISLGPEYAIPTGDFRENNGVFGLTDTKYNYGVGGSIKYLFHIKSIYGLSLQAGAIRYHSNTSSLTAADKGLSFTAIPVKLGGNFRYKSVFADPQLGLTSFTDHNTVYQSASTTYGLTAGSYIGNHIMLSGNYERWNKGGFAASHIGIRVAYTFSLGRLSFIDSIRTETAPLSYNFHLEYDKNGESWRKHKTFQTLGWVSIGVGVPLTLLGLVTAIASTESESIHRGTYQWMIGSGAALTVSSIPLFILSHKYKKMARK